MYVLLLQQFSRQLSSESPIYCRMEDVSFTPGKEANIRVFKEHMEATVELKIPIDTCSRLEVYVDYLTSTIIEAARQATPTAIRRSPILTLEGRVLLSHKRQYFATGDPSIYQQYSTATNRLRRLLANNRRANLDTSLESAGPDINSGFSIWKLTRGIKRQPLFQSPVQDRGGLWLKKDDEKASVLASHLSSTFMPFNLTDDTNREAIANFLHTPTFGTHHEVIMQLKPLQPKKPPGYDGEISTTQRRACSSQNFQ